MQDCSVFVQATEELRISGARLFRDGIVKNEQVLSKIKNGYQKLPKNSIQLFCKKYGVSAAWLYTGDGNMLLNRGDALGLQQREVSDEKLLYNTDFESCLDSNGQPVPCGNEVPVAFPMAGDFDFMCFNYCIEETHLMENVYTWRYNLRGHYQRV